MTDNKGLFLSSFLQRHVTQSRLLEGLEQSLRYNQKTVVLDNTILAPSREKNKEQNGKKRRHRKSMSAVQRKRLKNCELTTEQLEYELYLPLHQLWSDYISDLINTDKVTKKNEEEVLRRLSKADLHGAMLKVVKCKCATLVGVCGIVLMETKHVFKLITNNNTLKVMPKVNSVFSLQIGTHLVTLYGNNFCYKASERSARSFKMKPTIDL